VTRDELVTRIAMYACANAPPQGRTRSTRRRHDARTRAPTMRERRSRAVQKRPVGEGYVDFVVDVALVDVVQRVAPDEELRDVFGRQEPLFLHVHHVEAQRRMLQCPPHKCGCILNALQRSTTRRNAVRRVATPARAQSA